MRGIHRPIHPSFIFAKDWAIMTDEEKEKANKEKILLLRKQLESIQSKSIDSNKNSKIANLESTILKLKEELDKKNETEKIFKQKLSELEKNENKYKKYQKNIANLEKILENSSKYDKNYILVIKDKLNNYQSKLKLSNTYINILKKEISDFKKHDYELYLREKLNLEKEKKILKESGEKERKFDEYIEKLNEILGKINLNLSKDNIKNSNLVDLLNKLCDKNTLSSNTFIQNIYGKTKEEMKNLLNKIIEKINNYNSDEEIKNNISELNEIIKNLIKIKNISILHQIYLIIPLVNEISKVDKVLEQLRKLKDENATETIEYILANKKFLEIKQNLGIKIINLLSSFAPNKKEGENNLYNELIKELKNNKI